MPTLKQGRRAGQAMEASVALMAPMIEAGVTDKRDLLSELVQESLRQGLAYMKAEIDPADPEYSRKWAIRASIMATAMNTQTKVDELELRREKYDGFDALMRRVEEVRAQRARLEGAIDHSDPTPSLPAPALSAAE